MTRRRRFLCLSVLCTLASACLPGGRPPDFARPRRGAGLGVRAEPGAAVSGPFTAIFAGPEGENIQSPEPSLVFSRPVRALGQPPNEPALRAHFTPHVAGRWMWVGSSGARFEADHDQGFVESTEYTLEVEAGLRALDGSTLDAPVRIHFATPRPQLFGDGDYRNDVEADEKLSLRFSQVIAREDLQRGLRVTGSGDRPLPFSIEQEGRDWGDSVLIVPTEAWPAGETIRVALAAGVKGPLGPLPTDHEQANTYTIKPLPYVESLDCSRDEEDGRCTHGSQVVIQVSEPQRPSEFWPLVQVTPKVKLSIDKDKSDSPTSWFSFSGDFETDKNYKVEVTPPKASDRPRQGLRRAKKQAETRPLARGAATEVRFAPETPSVVYSFGGTYLPLSQQAELGAAASFTEHARVGARRLDPETILALAMAPDRDEAAAQLPGWNPIPLPADLHALSRWTSLASGAPTGPGAFLFLHSWKGLSREHHGSRALQRTDLGLSTRTTPDSTLVWVTRLSTGAPAGGVKVEVRDGKGHKATGETDKDGVIVLPTPDFGAVTLKKKGHPADEEEEKKRAHLEGWRLVFAREGEDQVYLQTSVPRGPRMNATMYTDRGLYRPGNTAQIKGYVRRPSGAGLESPEGLPLRLHLRDPEDHSRDVDVKLSAWGSFSYAVELGADAPIGYYQASLFSEDDSQLAYVSFSIEEYHPASFRVTSRLDKEQYTRGDEIKCSVEARYLYGGSMEGARVSWDLRRMPTSYRIPGLSNYELGDEVYAQVPRPRDSFGRVELDRAGQLSLTRQLDNPEQHGAELFVCDMSVWDASWESLASTSSAIVHPGEVYVAQQRPDRRQVAPGETITPKVLTPTPEGRLRAMPVTLELWHEFREIEGKREPPKLIQSCTVTTGETAVGCALQAPLAKVDPDDRFQVRARTRDGRGNEIQSSVRYYPTSERRRPPPPPKPRKQPKKREDLELSFRETSLKSGETAHATLRSPFPESHALVTVERQSILEHRVIHLDHRASTVDLPLTDADAPWVRVNVIDVAPHPNKLYNSGYRQTNSQINVEPTPRALDVKIRPSKTHLSPGEDIDVEVEVSQGDGSPARAEVTLYAADEGTLILANYRRPEPLGPLYDNRSLTVEGQQSRDSLGWAYDWKAAIARGGNGIGFQGFGSGHGRLGGSHTTKPPQVRMGATSVERARRDFRQVALFLPDLVTDEKGIVKAHFTLPDSLTTYRLMAVAVTKGDQAGSSETSLTTSKKLQVRPSLPHVIRVGDRFEVVANLANNGVEAIEAEVSVRTSPPEPAPQASASSPQASAAPAAPAAPGRITIEPAVSAPVHVKLEGGSRTTVSFPLAATHAGAGELTMQVTSAKDSDTTVEPFEVVTPIAPETQSIYGQTESAVIEQLGDLSRQREDVGGLDLTVAATPLAGLGTGFAQLIDYPYGCTEQTISRLVPLLSLRDLAKASGAALPADLDVVSQQAVDRVLRNQTKDGGFALWPGMDKSIDWLTIYAVWGLQEAQQHGAKVSQDSLARARAKLIEQVLRWSASDRDATLAAQSIDVLASDPEKAPPQLAIIASQLFAHRAELPAFGRAQLLHAMGLLHAPQDEQAALIKEIEGTLRVDGPIVRAAPRSEHYLDLLDSDVRTSALTLRAFLVTAPQHPLIGGLVMGLLADRKGGTWRTTQETTWALLALDGYRKATLRAPLQVDAKVTLGEGEASLLSAHFTGGEGLILPEQRALLPMAALRSHSPADLTIHAEGGPVYYQARLRFAPIELPTEPLSVGLEVRRRYLIIPPEQTSTRELESWDTPATSIPEGSFVMVRLDLIASGPRRFVVLDDPLPGGLEAINAHLRGGPRWLRDLEYNGASRLERRDDRVVFFFDDLRAGPHAISYVARATRKGTYITPPAHAEEMYTPETMGRTESLSISVVAAPPPTKPAAP